MVGVWSCARSQSRGRNPGCNPGHNPGRNPGGWHPCRCETVAPPSISNSHTHPTPSFLQPRGGPSHNLKCRGLWLRACALHNPCRWLSGGIVYFHPPTDFTPQTGSSLTTTNAAPICSAFPTILRPNLIYSETFPRFPRHPLKTIRRLDTPKPLFTLASALTATRKRPTQTSPQTWYETTPT